MFECAMFCSGTSPYAASGMAAGASFAERESRPLQPYGECDELHPLSIQC